ncbi:MAG TPA: hypothetical protein VF229_07120, partial [Burkholderiaceae bacterium]
PCRMTVAALMIAILSMFGSALLAADGGAGGPAPSWLEVRQATACEAMRDEYCLGRYGFTVRRDGTFVAGPSDKGVEVSGRITDQEANALRALLDGLSAQALAREDSLQQRSLPGVRDQLDIRFADGSVIRAYDLGAAPNRVRFRGEWASSRRLHDFIAGLMQTYYPIPFPDK